MESRFDVISFLDLLYLNEDVVDARLKLIMQKRNHTNKHLLNAIQLLQYKLLINTHEDSDCENDEEFEFAIEILKNLHYENVDYICKIIYIVLSLNNTTLLNKAQHIIQQILIDTVLSEDNFDTTAEAETHSRVLIDLKVCESVLDAIINKNEKISLLFLDTPLEDILDFTDEKIKAYFLSTFVPKLFKGVTDYNILDRIWRHIVQLEGDKKQNAVKVLSCLSDFYLPVPDGKNKILCVSEIVNRYEFWDIILFGLMFSDSAVRKISVYLTKRAIDSVIAANKDVHVHAETCIMFQWLRSSSKYFKMMWDNYFILLDSLEEKQSNIVLPSLILFETLNIGECWLNAAFNIGLKHDSTQVKLKCVEYRLKHKIRNQLDAVAVLEVFNNTNIYESSNYEILKIKIKTLFRDNGTLSEILKAIPDVKWSPVPFYYITDILASLEYRIRNDIGDVILNILKVSCTNTAIRKAAHYNVAQFINNCIENLNWKVMINFYSIMHTHFHTGFLLDVMLKKVTIEEEERCNFLNDLSKNISNIDLIIVYISENEDNCNLFVDILNEKILHINDIVSRQYSNKNECIDDAIFLTHLLNKTKDNSNIHVEMVYKLCAKQTKTLLLYVLSLFSNETELIIENLGLLFEKHNYEVNEIDSEDNLIQLYKTSILFISDVPDLGRAVLSIYTQRMLLKNPILINKYNHEMLNLTRFLKLVSNLKFKETQNQSVGRWKNMFYEKTCEVIYTLLKNENFYMVFVKQLIRYIQNVLECGGYGCLIWILRTVNIIVETLINDDVEFNITQFLNKVWNEIEELKSNNQYSPCIEEFVELITQDALLEKAMYNNIVILYCNKIIENGPIKTNPLFYLIWKLNQKCITKYSHLVYILCDILLYCPVTRKDERITNNVALQILQDSKYGINKNDLQIHFNYEIQYLAIKLLCSINDTESLNIITKFLTNKTDENFRNKQRYHGDSQPHKILQLTLQHILMMSLKCSDNLDWLFNWSLDLLVKLPHQPSVRICLEWIVALHFYVKKTTINEEILQILKNKKAPITSQFFILYWLLKHKIRINSVTDDEYDFVLDFLLSHTMGQLFNVRLHAQYLAIELHKLKKSTKFDYTITVIEKTFTDSNNDKSLAKFKVDYFANKFDLITDLNPYFIYYLLPKYCDSDGLEKIDGDFAKCILKDVVNNLIVDLEFKEEWRSSDMEEFVACDFIDRDDKIDDVAAIGPIQKKYIPWKNMSDINVYDVEKKVFSSSDLIVVASLIDKLPNLGGMARTSEVFGVNTYVVNSLRHLQDKQFQGLSVSAERWINIEEIRPGRALKEYLLRKKSEGYSIVAAEQTSTSCKLQTFKFPKKSLLLLGHEKEGVPCDLLPIMDYCVEIPQQGYVRSLNVHVTAAIFIWEYARQNVL